MKYWIKIFVHNFRIERIYMVMIHSKRNRNDKRGINLKLVFQSGRFAIKKGGGATI